MVPWLSVKIVAPAWHLPSEVPRRTRQDDCADLFLGYATTEPPGCAVPVGQHSDGGSVVHVPERYLLLVLAQRATSSTGWSWSGGAGR